tara:strand:- start:1035 stop:1652 length:618 start_codon:yes stop_codon:yes gene_type:complete
MKNLLQGIGNTKQIEEYYDNWSNSYEKVLKNWNYKTPEQVTKIISNKIKTQPKSLLDLACGTGLFVESFLKNYPKCICDGCDISKKILIKARKKKIYRTLLKNNFEKKIITNKKYDIVSLIGAMTYCKNYDNFLNLVYDYLNKNGFFIFTHRVDIWEKFNFDNIMINNIKFEIFYKSRPLNYLPRNKDFGKNIKIRVVLLKKANL